jgi:phenylalanyl-tRNA synthetase beta chain
LKILVSWLREFVDVRLPATDLADLLARRGFEVASVDPIGQAGDAVIDFEITANRPDCLSVAGLAREAATACRLPLALPWDGEGRPVSRARAIPAPTAARVAADGLDVAIEDEDLCPRYAAALAEVTVGPSPAWLADRLAASGVRPINNVVDVTNAVLIEIGHPLHAFDLERLAGRRLVARPARAGERIRTLDGEDRALEAGMLVIADADRPQAVAGVMGGAESEVWSATRLVAFESAYFKPVSVRRTSKRLGLKTEASSRFERGADINAPVVALERALALLERIGAGRRVGAPIDCYPAPRGPVTIELRRGRIPRLLGTSVADEEIVAIFTGLGFEVAPTADGWSVRIPTMRVDITREADLIEEVARHHGYDQVPATFPALRTMPPRPEPRIARKGLLRHVLTAAGFSEAISYSFVETAAARPFVDPGASHGTAGTGLVALAYPLSEKYAVLRPSLVPGLVDAVAHNRRRESPDVRLFEIGSVFSAARGEEQRLAFAWSGAGTPEHWGGGARPVDFFDAKGIVGRIGEALRLTFDFADTRRDWLVPGRAAGVSASGSAVGVVGQLSPAVAAARDLPGSEEIYVAELDLEAVDALVPTADLQVAPLPRFPSIVRDISIVVAEGLRSERIRETIRRAAPSTLVQVREFDRYKGKGIAEGRYSLSLRLTFRSPERTLTDVEVQQAMDHIVATLARDHDAVQR